MWPNKIFVLATPLTPPATTVIHPQCSSDGWGVVDENHSDIGVTLRTTMLAQL